MDRYYIESFLKRHSDDIKGRVLEIGDPGYTREFGGSKVERADVLHAIEGNPEATIVGDLSTGKGIPRSAFDCMILTQTLLCIYEVREAVANVYSALKPGGVLLATFPGISQISRYDMDRWGDYWRFTTLSAQKMFGNVFPPEMIEVKAHGNVLVAVSFLHGLATEELTSNELDFHDPDYEVLITVRAVKPEE
ncbi:MAG: methyltransferase [Syntrophaceae bacterium]|nr:methyltransferase [Syntrophaceae bacterium]